MYPLRHIKRKSILSNPNWGMVRRTLPAHGSGPDRLGKMSSTAAARSKLDQDLLSLHNKISGDRLRRPPINRSPDEKGAVMTEPTALGLPRVGRVLPGAG